MKHAIDYRGVQIEAGAGAPELGRCPHCGGFVVLRRRQGGWKASDVTYYWRHEDHENLQCPGRKSAAGRVVASERS